jgi:hypothetical protein
VADGSATIEDQTGEEVAPVRPVEQAIRAKFRTPTTLHTLGQGRPFVLERIDHNGIVLLLGTQRNCTLLQWGCLEGIVPFLRRLPGWVPAGGTFVVDGELGTLDEYLKDCISRQTSRWGLSCFRRLASCAWIRVHLCEFS